MLRSGRLLTGPITLLATCLLFSAVSVFAAQPLPFSLNGDNTSAVKAFVDPVTGELRAPEAGEEASVSSKTNGFQVLRQNYQHPDMGKVIKMKNGTMAMTLGVEHLSYAVATVHADGTVSFNCSEHDHSQQADAQPKEREE